MSQKMFITDFDGVVCDSVIECLLVTYNAYGRLHSPSYQRLLDIEAIDPKKRETFRKLRAFLKGAEDFVPLFMTIEQNISITRQKDFDLFREAHKEHLTEYVEAFYAERDFLKNNEKELWLDLNPLFEGFAEELQQRPSFERLHILTTKRQDDVVQIFQHWNISFPAKQITYMNATGKSQKLLNILQEHDADFAESVYFEDQVDFLVASQRHNIGSYLVDWGYVSEEQKVLAHQHNIPIITNQQYREILRKF